MKSALSIRIIELLTHENGEKEIEKLLQQILEKDPQNLDALMRLAILYMDMPFVDYPLSVPCLQKVFEIEPDNIKAWLLYAEFSDCEGPQCFTEEILDKLKSLKSDSPDINSMLKYVISMYYEERDAKQQEKYLCESIALYDKHVWNRIKLVRLYIQQNKKNEARVLLEQAIGNVVKIYNASGVHDYTDIEEYFNEFIRGTHIFDFHVEGFKRDLLKL